MQLINKQFFYLKTIVLILIFAAGFIVRLYRFNGPAGVLYPAFKISLRPEIAALLMIISSNIVAVNTVLLKRSEKDLIEA